MPIIFEEPVLGFAWIAVLAFVFWNIIVPVALGYAISQLTMKDPKIPSVEPDSFDAPTQREGTKFTVGFGLYWVENPIIDWYGDMSMRPIVRHQSVNEWGNNHRVYYTTGYAYSLGINLILTQGTCDGIKQIKVNDVVAWPDPTFIHLLADDGELYAEVNEPALLGGEDENGPRGGGVVGTFRFNYGLSSQTANAYMVTQLGSDITAHRGLTTITLENVELGTSPYMPTIKTMIKRTDVLTDGSEQWYIAKAAIGNSLNAIHIIRECLTDSTWGMKIPSSLLQDSVWQAAADALYAESFGLCMKWEDPSQTLKDFIQDVLRHINAVLYEDPNTGYIVIKLIRNDYDVDDLVSYDQSDIVEISDFNRGNVYEAINSLQLQFWNVFENKPVSIPDQDIALMDMQNGKQIERDVKYNGIIDSALAGQIIARERQQAGSFPVLIKIKAKRTMSGLLPGDVFILDYTNPEISGLILRVIRINLGTLKDGAISIEAVQDIFSIQPALYAAPPDSAWEDPSIEALLSPSVVLMELPYILFKTFASEDVFDIEVATTNGYPLLLATFAANSSSYELLFRPDTSDSFLTLGTKNYTESFQIDEDIPANAEQIVVSIKNWTGPSVYIRPLYSAFGQDYMVINSAYYTTPVFIGNEIFTFVSINSDLDEITLHRGAWDTVPQTHSKDDYGYFVLSYSTIIDQVIPDGDTPGVKLLTNINNSTLPEIDAVITNANEFNSRLIRPYPPDDIKINGTSYASTFTGEPTITWYHRDRTNTTTIQHTGHHGIATPEVGTTYTLKIYDQNNILVRTETGITGLTYTYAWDDELTDCGLNSGDALNTQLRFVLTAVRDGYDSWQSIDITVQRI